MLKYVYLVNVNNAKGELCKHDVYNNNNNNNDNDNDNDNNNNK